MEINNPDFLDKIMVPNKNPFKITVALVKPGWKKLGLMPHVPYCHRRKYSGK